MSPFYYYSLTQWIAITPVCVQFTRLRAMKDTGAHFCSCFSSRLLQCWRAGWTTPGSWNPLSPWPVCLSWSTAWNGCWHSWARCSRSPCTAPHEGAREQQASRCAAGGSLLFASSTDINARALLRLFSSLSLTWFLPPFLLFQRFCGVESDVAASQRHIWIFIWTCMDR